MTPLPSPQEYAYGLLSALKTGELENGLRVSFLIDGSQYRTRARIKEAIRLLEEDGFIEMHAKGRSCPPARIYLRWGVTNG